MLGCVEIHIYKRLDVGCDDFILRVRTEQETKSPEQIEIIPILRAVYRSEATISIMSFIGVGGCANTFLIHIPSKAKPMYRNVNAPGGPP